MPILLSRVARLAQSNPPSRRIRCMPPNPFDRPGWCDNVGPLWFLRPRWSVGPPWRSAWARYFSGSLGVTLQAHTKQGGYPVGGLFLDRLLWIDLSYAHKEDIIMGWVSRMRRPTGDTPVPASAVDSDWLSEFPALHEYVSLDHHDDGAARRTSTVTIFADGPSWKCFLNDRDSACSLCATGSSPRGNAGERSPPVASLRRPPRPRPTGEEVIA
jgi:hypothetical protein